MLYPVPSSSKGVTKSHLENVLDFVKGVIFTFTVDIIALPVFVDILVEFDKYRIQNTEYRIQNAEYRIQNTEYRIQNTEYRIQK